MQVLHTGYVLPERAEVLVTDWLDHRSVTPRRACGCLHLSASESLRKVRTDCSCLGMGLLKNLETAATNLLTANAVVIPAAVKVYAACAQICKASRSRQLRLCKRATLGFCACR